MGFDFTGIKTNLEGINKYLNANGITLSADESKQLESIFTQADTNKDLHANCKKEKGNNLIDHSEVPFFINLLATKLPNIAEKTASFFVDLNDSVNEGLQKLLDEGERHLKKLEKKESEAKTDAIKSTKPNYIPKRIKSIKLKSLETKSAVESLVKDEIKAKGIKLSNADIKYWSNLVDKVAQKYNVAPEILITIISKESRFEKNVNTSIGGGPMGVTKVAIEAFSPKNKNGKDNQWSKIYKDMHPELLNDILSYSKSATKLRSKIGSDDELGVLIGLLTYEMKYCSEVATKLYGKANYITIPKAISQVKNGYRLDKKSDEKHIKNIFKNYNGSKYKEQYSRIALDSLKRLTNNSFKNLIFIKNQ